MIGVVPRPDEIGVVEEFFELFKTPWELYTPGHHYDVVLLTDPCATAVEARLVVAYGSSRMAIDQAAGISTGARQSGGRLLEDARRVPVYGPLATLAGPRGVPCVAAEGGTVGVEWRSGQQSFIRLGYDLFAEVWHLLTAGQPIEMASVPTLDIHIRMLREWILGSGVGLLEIPPTPAGYSCSICLTHDIDFVGIRNHRFDHTMYGFLYRATLGAAWSFLRGRMALGRVLRSWRAAASLPAVFLGWAKDFWEPFSWYLEVEKDLPATYFVIPFKGRPGERVTAPHAARRAAAYDITEVAPWVERLRASGCEVAVHGIDAWHSVEKGREELARIHRVSGNEHIGVRMHWLLHNAETFRTLEDAGYEYDSTWGYNETVGYRSGTNQVFRPLGTKHLLELPLHVQDGALFYPGRLGLTESQARMRCDMLASEAVRSGGVLTVLWHDRSHAPERFWGDFYAGWVGALRSLGAWCGTASQVVGWFRGRRGVRFQRVGRDAVELRYEGPPIDPPLRVWVSSAARSNEFERSAVSSSTREELTWNGVGTTRVNEELKVVSCAPTPSLP